MGKTIYFGQILFYQGKRIKEENKTVENTGD